MVGFWNLDYYMRVGLYCLNEDWTEEIEYLTRCPSIPLAVNVEYLMDFTTGLTLNVTDIRLRDLTYTLGVI